MELTANNLKKNDAETKLQSITSELENVKKSKEIAEQNLEKLLGDFDSGEYERLLLKQQECDEKRKSYIERNTKLNNVRFVLEQYLDLNKNIENEKIKSNDLKLLFNQSKEAVLLAKTSFETKDSEFQMQKEMVEKWAKECRLRLKDGEACPVCGSTSHYYKDEQVVESLFACIKALYFLILASILSISKIGVPLHKMLSFFKKSSNFFSSMLIFLNIAFNSASVLLRLSFATS